MADDKSKTSSTQGKTGTATLEPEHHQTQATTGSPEAGGTSQGSQTGGQTAASSTGTTGTGTSGSTSGGTSQQGSGTGSQGSPWSPGSTSSTGSSGSSGLSRREPSLPSLGALGLWNPLALVDRFFDDFLGYGGLSRGRRSSPVPASRDTGQTAVEGVWYPLVEMQERDGKLIISVDLPGTKREDIHVEIRDDVLILRGERYDEREENQSGIYRSERVYGRFERVIPLPEGVKTADAEATFHNGVLEIAIPLEKREAQEGRRVEIK